MSRKKGLAGLFDDDPETEENEKGGERPGVAAEEASGAGEGALGAAPSPQDTSRKEKSAGARKTRASTSSPRTRTAIPVNGAPPVRWTIYPGVSGEAFVQQCQTEGIRAGLGADLKSPIVRLALSRLEEQLAPAQAVELLSESRASNQTLGLLGRPRL